ncbi:MAG: surface-adhesin E family protein [Steroidobacteraceae bacterium]
MRTVLRQIMAAALGSAALLVALACAAQTPDDQKAWDAQRAQALADQKIRAAQLEKERAARQANPMAWVKTLDPLTSGGWEFRTVADDGSWASFSTTHQMKRSGKIVSVWLRQEFAEPQLDPSGDAYLSIVQKIDYDCTKVQARPVLVIYYSANNIKGNAQTEQADPKQAPWTPIVPGTLAETNLQWACSAERASEGK